MKELFNGIAVVIDDEIDDAKANINSIVRQIEQENIPVLKFKELPEENSLKHFQSISFLLLDWNLSKESLDSTSTISLPDTIQQNNEDKNINFLNRIKQECFCPIFIFTNESSDSIENKLKERNILSDCLSSNIFIKPKNSLAKKGEFFKSVIEWIKKTPSVYVLKKWEDNYQKCKSRLFLDFYSVDTSWPAILWKNYETDKINRSLGLRDSISKNLYSRMTPFDFDETIFDQAPEVPKENLRMILEGERFIKKSRLDDDDVGTGDLFKEEYQDQETKKIKFRYFLNIRAQCDLIRNNKLYCLKGRIIEESEINGNKYNFNNNYGCFDEKISNSIVPFLDDGKIIEFLFRDLEVKNWGNLKDKRVGRLISPYINRVQQKYSLYMQRQGLPRIPDSAI